MLKYLNPKGTLPYEIFQLGFYWANMFRQTTNRIVEQRVSYGPHPRQYFLFFQPKNQEALSKGTLIYLHGGAWRFGSPEAFRATAQFFTDLNYSVILPSYRRCPTHNYRHIKEDLIELLKTSNDLIEEQSLHDRPRIIGGMSAGGHLSALVFLDEEILSGAGWDHNALHGAFLLGAPLHLEKMANTKTLRDLAGKPSSDLFQEANPYNFIQKPDHRPLLIVHGEKDGMVAFQNAQAFVEKLEQCGYSNFTFQRVTNASHLDVASWAFTQNTTRRVLIDWLEKVHH